MEGFQPFSDEITEAEQGLGFVLAVIINPRRHCYANSSIIRGVVCPLGKGSRIIKLKDPTGNITYEHQESGKKMENSTPNWLPVFNALPDANLAIAAARQGQRKANVLAIAGGLPLRCPACRTHFLLKVDYMPVGATTKCPFCGHTGQCDDFKELNLIDCT